jgi:CheY-like chemotaxis protein
MPNPTRETVLYVDDDPDDQEFFVTSLSESRPNALCYLATDSKTAFEVIQKIPTPNYIFIDLHLPKVSGIELLKMLKGMTTYSAIPTYILSTTLFEPHALAIREIGGNGFFRKPASLNDFRTMLESILSK